MTRTPRLTSDTAACCWIPLFALRCETARRPELASLPLALLAPDDTRRLWQVAPLARRAGVKPGMTVSQAIGLCPALRLIEPDPVHYEDHFARLIATLHEITPVVEPGELGVVYLGTDGLAGIFGSPEKIIELIKKMLERWHDGIPRSIVPTFRLGWGRGKFVSWVAASRAKPGEGIIVPVGGEGHFLASQS